MFLNLFIELILITVIVGGSCYGYKKGVFMMVAGRIRNPLCLLLSLSLCGFVGEECIAPLIRTPIISFLYDFLYDKARAVDSFELPTVLKMLGAVFGISFDGKLTEATVDNAVRSLSEPFIDLISRAVAFIIVFIFLKLSIKLITYLADSFLDHGIIGILNHISGAVISVFVSVLFAIVITTIVDYLFRTDIFSGSRLVRDFDGGPLYRLINKLNPLTLLLSF